MNRVFLVIFFAGRVSPSLLAIIVVCLEYVL
jgi:hypothetical protein